MRQKDFRQKEEIIYKNAFFHLNASKYWLFFSCFRYRPAPSSK